MNILQWKEIKNGDTLYPIFFFQPNLSFLTYVRSYGFRNIPISIMHTHEYDGHYMVDIEVTTSTGCRQRNRTYSAVLPRNFTVIPPKNGQVSILEDCHPLAMQNRSLGNDDPKNPDCDHNRNSLHNQNENEIPDNHSYLTDTDIIETTVSFPRVDMTETTNLGLDTFHDLTAVPSTTDALRSLMPPNPSSTPFPTTECTTDSLQSWHILLIFLGLVVIIILAFYSIFFQTKKNKKVS
jgi:hypothetical protein